MINRSFVIAAAAAAALFASGISVAHEGKGHHGSKHHMTKCGKKCKCKDHGHMGGKHHSHKNHHGKKHHGKSAQAEEQNQNQAGSMNTQSGVANPAGSTN